MEAKAQLACKFHKSGHCKFGQKCRHFHSNIVCSSAICDKSCQHRHPKACLYHLRFGQCKFGNKCSYLHPDSNQDNSDLAKDVEELKTALKQVLKVLEAKAIEIKKLEDKVNAIEATKDRNMQEELFVYNSHLCSMEKERSQRSNDSLHPSLSAEEREEDTTPLDSPSLDSDQNVMQCEYWLCDYASQNESEMKHHIADEHTIDSTFTYPNSSEKVICQYDIGPQDLVPNCEECGEEFLLNHTFAMHLYNAHKVGYSCVHCGRYFPGGDEFYEIHLKMCSAPCDGHRHCPCRK